MTVRARLVLLVMLGASLAGARAAFGQDQAAAMFGQPVVAVHFTIEGRDATSPALIGLSDVRVGQPGRERAAGLDLPRAARPLDR